MAQVVVVNSTKTVGSTPIEIEVSSVPSTTYERNLAEGRELFGQLAGLRACLESGIKSLYQTCQMCFP